jgi:two-component system chemotaxis response regulator CheY
VLVLVADDDTTCRHVATAVVQKLGHECLAAHDGTEAWKVLQQRPVDVLITDWMMPGLDGPELCRRVRGEAQGYIYIIMVTSLNERDNIVAGMEAGTGDYLTKPLGAFDVKTRLIAAARVTALCQQIDEFHSELQRLNAQLAVQARADPLTGLGNRLALPATKRKLEVGTRSWAR